MRRYILIVMILLVVGAAVAGAQETEQDGQSFVRTVRIEKVLESQYGYKLIYKGADLIRREVYLPARWFYDASNRLGLVAMTHSTSAPYMQVFYENGEFTHLRLVLQRNSLHESYGSLKEPFLRNKFDSVTELEID